MSKPNGYVLHEDSERIVVATGFTRKSANAKTGDMIQVFILARRDNPLQAIKTGSDSLICGDCPLRGLNGQKRTCYVNVGQAPLAVWRAFNRGSYPALTDLSVFHGRKVRFGSYGDPVFMPLAVLQAVANASAGWTGYTHQWRNPLFAAYRAFVMASVETADGFDQAHAAGWRTFRVSASLTDLRSNEIVCPNTTRGISCADCRLCAGTSKNAKSIVIEAHGSGKAHLSAAVNN